MPNRPPRICSKACCSGVVSGNVCSVCGPRKPRTGWKPRNGSRQQRGYGADWERWRARKLNVDPLCEYCLKEDIVTPATQVDHIVPFRGVYDPKRLEWGNLASCCERCHMAKTARDK